jgi:hypothetical protein
MYRTLIVTFALISSGCSSSSSNKHQEQQLSFDVIDSLLGPEYEVPSAEKSFRPATGFLPIPDSLFEILRERFAKEIGTKRRIDFIQFFFDQQHSAGLIVSTVQSLNLQTDTTEFLQNYYHSLVDMYGSEHVKAGDYWVDSIFVKNYLVMDSLHVRFHLLCLSAEGNALALEYVVPNQSYPDVVKSLESSIGTLKPIRNGG